MMNSKRVFHGLCGLVLLVPGLTSCGMFGGSRPEPLAQTPVAAAAAGSQNQVKRKPTRATGKPFADGIAATVNGRVITKSEVREAVMLQRFAISQKVRDPKERQRQMRNIEEKGLDVLIERELTLSEYDKLGGPVQPQHIDSQVNHIIRVRFGGDRDQFIQALRESGITMRKFREDQAKAIKVIRMKAAITRGKTRPPSPREVNDYYKKNIADYREEGTLRVRTINLRKRSMKDPLATPKTQFARAQDILRKLKRGEDFAALARQYSEDSVASKGGDRGQIARESSTLNRVLTNVAFQMKAGEVSEIIESQTGFYIVKVDSRQYGRTAPLNEVRDEIENILQSEQRQDLVDAWVATQKKRAMIKRYGV